MIDVTRLNRDYSQEPIKLREWLTKEEMEYLYLELNLCCREIGEFCGRNSSWAEKNRKKFGIKKSKEQQQLARESYFERNYGCKNPAQLEQSKQKFKKTCKERYGCENPQQNKEIHTKSVKTCIAKYGVDNPAKMDSSKEKAQETSMKKYGVLHPMQHPDVISKQHQSVKQSLGVEHPLQSLEVQKKLQQTCNERYGTDNAMQNSDVKKRLAESIFSKYGVTNVAFVPEIIDRGWNTKKQRGSFNSSNEEKQIHLILKELFIDVKTQYKSDEYPFHCDFYVVPLDLYIEYQGYPSHGTEPFNPNNPQHLEQINKWRTRATEVYKGREKKQYLNWITTWTKTDPIKRNHAKINKLNWIEFFNLNDFMDWITKL